MTKIPTLEVLERHLSGMMPHAVLQTHAECNVLIYVSDGMFVGFTIASDELAESYDRTYKSFKEIYLQQTRSDLEPSFVICTEAHLDDLEAFSSAVETDVYFCRKYVLPFSGSVHGMLAQLPFLPLDAIEGIEARPETAQTFLRRMGVSSELARHIAVPAQRSAEAIVDLTIQGHYGEPTTSETHLEYDPEKGETRIGDAAIKVESIEIESFRAYKRRVTFNLGHKVTFLYGPNGFGKTSFFDAFDFGLTGGIGRLETENRGADLQTLAPHLDSPAETSVVSMAVRLGDQRIVIDRRVNDAKSPKIDGAKTDRKTLLSTVTGALTPSAERIENLVNLFRATHLFSQEQQELTKDMQAKSELSSDIVSRMLALDDYASSSSKLSAVITEIEARQRRSRTRGNQAEERASEARRIISELSAQMGDGTSVDINALITPLIQEAASVGVVVVDQESNVAALRALRASLEYMQSQLQSEEGQLSTLRLRASSRNELVEQAKTFRTELASQSQGLLAIEELKRKAEIEKGEAREVLDRSVERENQISQERSLLAWTLLNFRPYRDLLSQAREIEERLPGLAAMVQFNATAAHELQTSLNLSEDLLQSKRSEALEAEQLLANAEVLLGKMDHYIALSNTRGVQQRVALQLSSAASELASAIASAESSAEEARNLVSDLRQRLLAQEESHDELRSLVDQLRAHTHSSECPFCGHNHGTKEALLQRVARYDDSDPHAELREALRSAREIEKERDTRLSSLKEQVRANGVAAREAAIRLQQTEAEISQIDALCAESGVRYGADQSLADAVKTLTETYANLLATLYEQLTSAEEHVTEQVRRVEKANEALFKSRAEHTSNVARLAEIRRDAAEVEKNSNFVERNFLSSNDDLQARALRLTEQHGAASNEVSIGRSSLLSIESRLGSINEQIVASRETIVRLSDQLTASERAVETLDLDLSQAGLTPLDALSAINSLSSDISSRRARSRTLLEKVKSAEIAADAATTAAALNAHRATLEEQSNARDSAFSEAKKYDPWLSFFKEVERKIKAQRNEAVSNFTTRYGPRTSVIQKRLRAVYGFEDVSIASSDSRISVSVSRHGKKLRPTDYFSQSQQQTLLLGLFLTACSSQTWSQFGPVLLDDPVAHFDDLNTYAFLDLIRGLLLDEGRQFVISTCDERFMQMAIRKFKTLGDGAKFYRFQSIGAEGPDIAEI